MECLFSASQDAFKVHLWEPHRVCDNINMGWGKVRDIAVASTQMVRREVSAATYVVWLVMICFAASYSYLWSLE